MAFKSTLHQTSTANRRVLHCQPPSNLEVIRVRYLQEIKLLNFHVIDFFPLQTCADLSEDLSNWKEGEIIVKTKNDSWVIGKLANNRELYVIVTRKNAEFIDVCGMYEISLIKNSSLIIHIL